MTIPSLQQLGKRTAVVSSTGGLLLFLLYYFIGHDAIVVAGLAYILVIGFMNIVVLILVVSKAYNESIHKVSLLRTAGLMLLNLPIAILLLWFTSILMGVMRLSIVNASTADITDVVIMGCVEKRLATIKAGESETVWVIPPGDCSVSIFYKQGFIHKQEEVLGYLTPGMGGKETHTIGTKKQGVER